MFKKIQKPSFLISFLFFTFLLISPADALVISPAIKKLYVKPGDQVVEVVNIANDTNKQLVLFPVVENFKQKDDRGTPEFLGDTDPEGSARWIQLPFKQITLAAGERKDFLFKINIPEWARPGGHYAALFWNTQQDALSGVGSVSRVGSLFLFGVAGKITGEMAMSGVRVMKNKNNTVEGFSFAITNKSNIHVTPKGQIDVFNFFGKRVAELPLNALEKNVLAQSERIFFEQWKQSYTSYGRLRARVRSEFDFGFPAEEREVIFYNLPRFAGVKLLVMFLLVFFIIRKIYQRKRLKKEHSLILGS